MAVSSVIQSANDPGTKDSLPVSAIPAIPPAETGFHSLDNVMFSNVQRRHPYRPVIADERKDVYFRLPGLVTRPIRPRQFIRVSNADVTDLRTPAGTLLPFTNRSEGDQGVNGGATVAGSFTFTGAGAEDFTADGVVSGDILILSDAGGSNGRYVVREVTAATTLLLDCPTPATDGDVTYDVITPRNFVDEVNRLINVGSLEIRNDSGTLQDPIVPA